MVTSDIFAIFCEKNQNCMYINSLLPGPGPGRGFEAPVPARWPRPGPTSRPRHIPRENPDWSAPLNRAVALVSSGDPGIYAMAALVFELLDREERADWHRAAVTVVPGISALQAAAARVGV